MKVKPNQMLNLPAGRQVLNEQPQKNHSGLPCGALREKRGKGEYKRNYLVFYILQGCIRTLLIAYCLLPISLFSSFSTYTLLAPSRRGKVSMKFI